MKILKRASLAIAFVATAAAADPAALPAHPELYSFADIYRLAVGAPALAAPAAEPVPVRFAVAQGAPALLAAGPRFSVSAIAQPEGWMLLVSGLALAGWVAHRRLVNAL